MDTSFSNNPTVSWTATALLFSGRPDPSWEVMPLDAEALMQIWAALPPSEGPSAIAPILGYRGCTLRCEGGGEWCSFGGCVTFTRGAESEIRVDAARLFYNRLLDTAPAAVRELVEMIAQEA